jgi:hypothetical protein
MSFMASVTSYPKLFALNASWARNACEVSKAVLFNTCFLPLYNEVAVSRLGGMVTPAEVSCQVCLH